MGKASSLVRTDIVYVFGPSSGIMADSAPFTHLISFLFHPAESYF